MTGRAWLLCYSRSERPAADASQSCSVCQCGLLISLQEHVPNRLLFGHAAPRFCCTVRCPSTCLHAIGSLPGAPGHIPLYLQPQGLPPLVQCGPLRSGWRHAKTELVECRSKREASADANGKQHVVAESHAEFSIHAPMDVAFVSQHCVCVSNERTAQQRYLRAHFINASVHSTKMCISSFKICWCTWPNICDNVFQVCITPVSPHWKLSFLHGFLRFLFKKPEIAFSLSDLGLRLLCELMGFFFPELTQSLMSCVFLHELFWAATR